MPQPRRRCRWVLRAGGSLRSGSRWAVRRHNSAALCRSAPLRPLHPAAAWRDGLTKPAFFQHSPPIFAAVAAVGRSLRSLRAACGGTFSPPAAAELCRPQLCGGLACSAAQSGSVRSNRQGLRVAVRTTRPQVHIIASRICRCGSIVAAHGQGCKFACIAEQRKFSVHCAGLSAPQAVF